MINLCLVRRWWVGNRWHSSTTCRMAFWQSGAISRPPRRKRVRRESCQNNFPSARRIVFYFFLSLSSFFRNNTNRISIENRSISAWKDMVKGTVRDPVGMSSYGSARERVSVPPRDALRQLTVECSYGALWWRALELVLFFFHIFFLFYSAEKKTGVFLYFLAVLLPIRRTL